MKRRLGDVGRREFGTRVAGRVEQWYKWSSPLEDGPGARRTDRIGLWLPVERTRSLRVFGGDEDRSLGGGVPGSDSTVHVEVTAVAAPPGTAWTCGLEADTRPASEALVPPDRP